MPDFHSSEGSLATSHLRFEARSCLPPVTIRRRFPLSGLEPCLRCCISRYFQYPIASYQSGKN